MVGIGYEAYTCFLGFLEEGFDGYACAVGAEATVVLFVSFGRIVVRVEAANAMEIVSPSFSKFFGEGESKVTPVVVAGSDICACGFYALGYGFNVV